MPQPAPASVDLYLAAQTPEARAILERLRALIHRAAPEVVESIKYGMPLFRWNERYLYLGAWKHHIGLYPIPPLPPELEPALAPFRAHKDTVQFKYREPVPYEVFERLVAEE